MAVENPALRYLRQQEISGGPLIYLQRLLGLSQEGTTEVVPVDLFQIQEVMREALNAQLPEALISQLRLEGLNWGLVTLPPGSSELILPILFLGCQRDPIIIQDALGTIELKRLVDDEGKLPGQISSVRIGGTVHDSMDNPRVLGVRYSCFSPDDYNAFRFDISFSNEELRRLAERSGGSQTREIPTDINHPYSTAALITKAMVGEVEGHKTVLTTSWERGWGIHGSGITSKGENYILQYRAESIESLWEISIPKSLQRV